MFGIDDAAIAAAASSALSYFGQQSANETNLNVANAQMAFQKQMSNTAHQREVKDLNAAGLNPMISAMRGQGASTPAGATTRVESATKDAVNSGATAATVTAMLDKIKAETNQSNTAAALNAAQIPTVQALSGLHTASAGQARSAENLNNQQVEHISQQISNLAKQYELTHYQIEQVKEDIFNAIYEGKNLQEIRNKLIAETGSVRLTNEFMELEIPRRVNEARAQKSWWMENVSPYIPDSSRVVSSAAGLAAAGGLGYRVGRSGPGLRPSRR